MSAILGWHQYHVFFVILKVCINIDIGILKYHDTGSLSVLLTHAYIVGYHLWVHL